MKTPLIFLIAALVGSTITLIVTIVVNATVANEPDNDLGSGTGWALLTPAPVLSLLWTLLDITILFVWRFHEIYWLITTTVLMALYAGFGGATVAMYAWSDEGAWVGGMFLLFMAMFYVVSMVFAAKAVHQSRKGLLSRKTMDG